MLCIEPCISDACVMLLTQSCITVVFAIFRTGCVRLAGVQFVSPDV
jgi:hypothetical protein